MKKQKLMLASLLLTSATVVQAQDTYWPLDGNKIFNTQTKAVNATAQALTPFGGFGFNSDANVVFNSSAEVLFTGGPNSPNFAISGIGQVLPIPNECKKFVSLEIVPSGPPWGHTLRTREIDATTVTNNINTTGLPSTGLYTTLWNNQIDPVYFGAVAAKLNSNGTRYFYHLNVIPSTYFAKLTRYELDVHGNVTNPSTPTTISSTLPYGTNLDISNDGETIGYINSDGYFVTYHMPTSTLTTYNTYQVNVLGGEIPAIEQADGGGQRRWFLGNSTTAGYVVEGSTTFYDITGSNSEGTNTSFALGKDGNMYFAFSPGGGSVGNLYWFNTSINYLTSDLTVAGGATNQISGAQISSYDPSGTAFLFGNHVAGEDINSATGPLTAPSFTVGGLSSSPTTSQDIVICSGGSPTLQLLGTLYGITTGYTIQVDEGTLIGSTFTVTGNQYDDAIVDNSPTLAVDLFSLFGSLASWNGHIRVTLSSTSPCGGSISTVMIFNLIQASAVVDFWMIGPKDAMNSTPSCISHHGLASPAYDGAQVRIDNIADVNTARPSQPIASTTPPCSDGWLGAISVGIWKGALTTNNTTVASTNGYEVNVDEYTSGGTFIQNVLNKNPATFPASGYPFIGTTNTPLYFYNNYTTIRDNYYYHVTLSVTTVECGVYSKDAYFKILDGGPLGALYKGGLPTGINTSELTEMVTIFPNPASNNITLSWFSNKGENASIILQNVVGQTVLQKGLTEVNGINSQSLDISALAPGMYQYTLHTSDGDHKGKLVKQ